MPGMLDFCLYSRAGHLIECVTERLVKPRQILHNDLELRSKGIGDGPLLMSTSIIRTQKGGKLPASTLFRCLTREYPPY